MAETRRPGILRNLRIKRVSLVDSGANFDPLTGDGAHILLAKRAEPVEKEEGGGGQGLGAAHVDSTDWREDYEKATIDADTRNKLPDSAFAAVWTDAKGTKQRKLPIHDAGHLAAARGRIDEADIPADVKAQARRKIDAATKDKEKDVKKSLFTKMLELFKEADPVKRDAAALELAKAFPDDVDGTDENKPVHKADDADCKCADCMAKGKSVAKAKAAEEGTVVSKAVEEVNKQNVELAKANVALAARVEKMETAAAEREVYDILKSFQAAPVKLTGADSDVIKFAAMRKSDPAMFDRMMALFTAADEQVKLGKSFQDIGSGRSGGKGDAWGQLVAKAKGIIEKGNTTKTLEQVLDEVMVDPANNTLVKQYRTEQQ